MGSSNGSRHSNLKNPLIAFLASLPSKLFYLFFLNHYNDNLHSLSPLWDWCYQHPFLLSHILFFLNVNVLFWMIDAYWTVIPVLLVHYYATHPLAEVNKYNIWRSRIVIFLTKLSSTRGVLWLDKALIEVELINTKSSEFLLSSARSNAITYLVFLMGICMPMYIDCPLRKQGMNYLGFGCYGCLFVWNNYVDIQVHDFVRLVMFAWYPGCGWSFVGALTHFPPK
ncbi:hypothetical protein M9H77_35146 [Catharanthus roseus]|uniref:Uncharacterized protein n=1 Tax=Catharanthus roseus TaxID=4058 RepID=A0ACB9ZPF2_CATRO|nr:hypothetical protein M9H77_35146 [Catharanthus roseus]